MKKQGSRVCVLGVALSLLTGSAMVNAQSLAAGESSVTEAVPGAAQIVVQENVEAVEVAPVEEGGFWDKFEWSLAISGVVQGNMGSDVWDDQADAVYGIDLDAFFQLDDVNSFYVLLEAGGGEGVDGRIGTFSGWNDHAWGDDSIEVSEVWWERTWMDGRLRGRIGKVDLTTDFDTNAYANDEVGQFMSSGFVNNLAVDIPDNTFGAMLWWQPAETLSVGLGYQSTSGWDDIFDRNFGILEIGWHPVFCGHQGNYRFYGWAGSWAEDPDEEMEAYSTYGWGFSFDQEITSKLGLWCRYGWKPDEEFNPIDQHISFGFQLMNFDWRPNDTIGLGYGIATLSDSYAQTLENPDDEHHIELYYQAQLTENIFLTPNFQWVDNAEGDAENDTVFVMGLRGVIAL